MTTAQADMAAIVFADIVGSTQIYENLGNTKAQALITGCLDSMMKIAKRSGGRLIKTIGDELMCELPNADAATEATAEIQRQLQAALRPKGPRIQVRIGFHCGKIVRRDGDVFGDAVNVAARMAAIAKGSQIITTEATVEQMNEANKTMTRQFDITRVKGKSEAIAICEVLWNADDVTAMIYAAPRSAADAVATELKLQCKNQHKRMRAGPKSFTIGRELDCDLTVAAASASRHHARIEWRRGKFVLIDQSTNGTFVRVENDGMPGDEFFLRREEFPLIRSGSFTLGQHHKDAGEFLIRYSCK